jgi:hypothetical protein
MNNLDKLEKLVLKAKVRAKSGELKRELNDASEALHQAKTRYDECRATIRETREALQQIEAAQARLKVVNTELAQFRSQLTPEDLREAENLVAGEAKMIEITLATKRKDLADAETQLEALTVELEKASERYRRIRGEADEIGLDGMSELDNDDSLLRQVDVLFPRGALQSLILEVREQSRHYAAWEQNEQFARLKVWIARYRFLQHRGFHPDDEVNADATFRIMRNLSEHYRPGNIEAFRKDFETNWEQFVVEAERELEAVLAAKQRREKEEQERRERRKQEEERQKQLAEEGAAALADLKTLAGSNGSPPKNAEAFRETVKRVEACLGAGHAEMLEIVHPWKELLEGQEFRAVRRHLERLEQNDTDVTSVYKEEYADLIALTRGRKGVMIGGDCREEARRQLEDVFEFQKLEWTPYESSRPAALKSLKERVRNKTVDIVLILKEYIAHHVPEQLRPLCEQYEIPCLMVEHGYGVRQVAQTLQRGLMSI